jgi:hypothetical protein
VLLGLEVDHQAAPAIGGMRVEFAADIEVPLVGLALAPRNLRLQELGMIPALMPNNLIGVTYV